MRLFHWRSCHLRLINITLEIYEQNEKQPEYVNEQEKRYYQRWLFRQACVLMEVEDGAVQERDSLLKLRIQGFLQKLTEAQDYSDYCHSLKIEM